MGHVAFYLITIALGYWVVTLAGKEQKNTKTLGQWIGWAIVVVSVCGLLCNAVCRVVGSCSTVGVGSGFSCPYSGGAKMSCPDMKDMKGMQGMDKKADVPATTDKKAAK